MELKNHYISSIFILCVMTVNLAGCDSTSVDQNLGKLLFTVFEIKEFSFSYAIYYSCSHTWLVLWHLAAVVFLTMKPSSNLMTPGSDDYY